jgi:hypothetical protein
VRRQARHVTEQGPNPHLFVGRASVCCRYMHRRHELLSYNS